MAKIKQFKIARRLGAPIFPKCESPKFSLAKKIHGNKKGGRGQVSEYGLQLLEKQKARHLYGVGEKQFSNYVKAATQKQTLQEKDTQKTSPADELYKLLESRLDNVVYRMGLAKTRRFARQMVSHGHVLVNGRKMTIPSYATQKGDVISIRPESSSKPLFANLPERLKDHKPPAWLLFDANKKTGSVEGAPVIEEQAGIIFDLKSVIEFYSR